jgi:hypothetical protein
VLGGECAGFAVECEEKEGVVVYEELADVLERGSEGVVV